MAVYGKKQTFAFFLPLIMISDKPSAFSYAPGRPGLFFTSIIAGHNDTVEPWGGTHVKMVCFCLCFSAYRVF